MDVPTCSVGAWAPLRRCKCPHRSPLPRHPGQGQLCRVCRHWYSFVRLECLTDCELIVSCELQVLERLYGVKSVQAASSFLADRQGCSDAEEAEINYDDYVDGLCSAALAWCTPAYCRARGDCARDVLA